MADEWVVYEKGKLVKQSNPFGKPHPMKEGNVEAYDEHPFQSKAQWKWMRAAEARGEVPKGTSSEWAHKSKSYKSLPEKA